MSNPVNSVRIGLVVALYTFACGGSTSTGGGSDPGVSGDPGISDPELDATQAEDVLIADVDDVPDLVLDDGTADEPDIEINTGPECTKNAHCDDGDPCTNQACHNQKCLYAPVPGCCHDDDDCVTESPCNAVGSCGNGWCEYTWAPECCWAPPVFNPDTGAPWEDDEESQAYASSQCQPPTNNSCNPNPTVWCELPTGKCRHYGLPHCQDFNGPDSLDKLEWSKLDYGTSAASHWSVKSDGTLGPDGHVEFGWSPTAPLVKSVLATPVIDASSAETSGFNPEQAVTVQWRMAYKHTQEGETVTLSVVATTIGDFKNGSVLWKATIDHDIEYDLYSVKLPDPIKFSETLQIGFMVEAESTFHLDNWQIDDFLVAEGVANELKLTRLYQCETEACNLSNGAVLIENSTTGVPDLTMLVNEHYQYLLCYKDVDTNNANYNFWGRPHAYLETSPLDTPGFVTPFIFGGSSSCFTSSTGGINAMCGAGVADYYCSIDINPQGLEANQGIYHIGILGQDEWHMDPDFAKHSPFQSLNKTTVTVQ